jgi:hypothetical protein
MDKQKIFDIQDVMLPEDFAEITGAIDDKVNTPLMKAYFEEYQRTMTYGLPKVYYIGYIKGLYNQIKKEGVTNEDID